MKIRADEHVAVSIVDIVRELALSPRWEISSVKETDQGASDVHWVRAFANDGGKAILTADTDFLKRPPQVQAVFETGMRVIHLPPKWANAPGHLQAAHILQWWRRIESQVEAMNDRECYRPDWNIREQGDLKKVQVDYAAAQKKLKKAARKAG